MNIWLHAFQIFSQLPWILCQMLLVMLLAPFLNTLMKKTKAILQGRQGPPLWQGYFDLLKYFHKETVVSHHATWIFLNAPLILFAISLTASLLVPTFFASSTVLLSGGIILFIYLMGLGRFFLASAAMEPGGGFCGMAGSREMMLASLIEPVSLLALFVLALMAGSTDLLDIMTHLSGQTSALYSPAYVLCLLALLIAGIAEVGRIPFDNPETHYELTMIHEGMLLDYSGKPLGMMLWAAWIKQTVILSLLANLFFPWGFSTIQTVGEFGVALVLYLVKILAVSLLIALVETIVSKVRLFRVTEIFGVSFILSLLGLILLVQQNMGGHGG